MLTSTPGQPWGEQTVEGQGRNREEATALVQASNDATWLQGGRESRRVGRLGMCYLTEMSTRTAGSRVDVREREEPRFWVSAPGGTQLPSGECGRVCGAVRSSVLDELI